jgi:hypothetical protein
MPRLDIVVAYFNEDPSWLISLLARLCECQQIDTQCFLYYNNRPLESRVFTHLTCYFAQVRICQSNTGREAHAYLHHICHFYEKLPDYTAFLHHDHTSRPNVDLAKTLIQKCTSYSDRSGPLGRLLTGDQSARHDGDSSVELDRACDLILGIHVDRFTFSPGAQYCISSSLVNRRPLGDWSRILDLVNGDTVNAWEMEYFWCYLFHLQPNAAIDTAFRQAIYKLEDLDKDINVLLIGRGFPDCIPIVKERFKSSFITCISDAHDKMCGKRLNIIRMGYSNVLAFVQAFHYHIVVDLNIEHRLPRDRLDCDYYMKSPDKDCSAWMVSRLK